MDLPMGEDLYDSFIDYQRRVIEELDRLAREYRFETLDANARLEENSEELAAASRPCSNRAAKPRPRTGGVNGPYPAFSLHTPAS